MREIIFDTETTGLDPARDQLVELGCVELINHIPTGRRYHTYLKPDCPMSADAERIHGLTEAFLADKPAFAAVVDDFLNFVDDAVLIAHNATFDLGFINAELGRLGRQPIPEQRFLDTLMLARRRHPAGPNSLDALCGRYGIDLSQRMLHGALLDASLLAEVYIELIGGRQAHLGLGLDNEEVGPAIILERPAGAAWPRPEPLASLLSAAERAAHQHVVAGLGAAAVWLDYLQPAEPAAAAG